MSTDNYKQQNCENCNLPSESLITVNAENFRKNHLGRNNGNILVCQKCHRHYTGRNNRSQIILTSNSKKRLIVAGPGTGKTFTFGAVIKCLSCTSSALVFTLINNLASELRRDLTRIDDREVMVNTFHGYCKRLLHSNVSLSDINKNFEYTHILPVLIEEDARLLNFNFSEKDFSRSFANLDEGAELQFYLNRASYYNAVSHIDSVYRVYSFFKTNPEKIPKYNIVIADEYQDFNKLEAVFIELLAIRNKILLAGDDDQALYGFRQAKKKFIRDLHDHNDSFENLYLPFCSRCTPVVVDGTNRIVENAQKRGLLKNRIERKFISYWPDKYKEHFMYPNLYLAKCSRLDTVGKYVEEKILKITEKEELDGEEKDLPFMIIGPESGYHLDKIKKYLLTKLDGNIFEVIDSRNKSQEINLLEGYRFLCKGVNKNLGWRVVLYADSPENIIDIISQSYESNKDLEDLLPVEYRKRHMQAIDQLPENFLSKKPEEDNSESQQKIRVLLTNYLGSKGLSALHVMIVGLNNYTFPMDPISIKDEEICKFIVALTRAKNSCSLVTNKEWDKSSRRTIERSSVFLSWLPQDKLKSNKYRVKGGKLIEE